VVSCAARSDQPLAAYERFAGICQHSLTVVATRLYLSGGRNTPRKLWETQNGTVRTATVSSAVCVHHIISHHFSVVLDRLGGMADGSRGIALITGRPTYRRVFEFWLKIFGVAFGLGVVSGIVMAFQFGTNWSELSRMSGPIQGPLLRRACCAGTRPQRHLSPRRHGLLHGGAHLLGRFRHARDLVLAIYDSFSITIDSAVVV
jgi:hypothetical protein